MEGDFEGVADDVNDTEGVSDADWETLDVIEVLPDTLGLRVRELDNDRLGVMLAVIEMDGDAVAVGETLPVTDAETDKLGDKVKVCVAPTDGDTVMDCVTDTDNEPLLDNETDRVAVAVTETLAEGDWEIHGRMTTAGATVDTVVPSPSCPSPFDPQH